MINYAHYIEQNKKRLAIRHTRIPHELNPIILGNIHDTPVVLGEETHPHHQGLMNHLNIISRRYPKHIFEHPDQHIFIGRHTTRTPNTWDHSNAYAEDPLTINKAEGENRYIDGRPREFITTIRNLHHGFRYRPELHGDPSDVFKDILFDNARNKGIVQDWWQDHTNHEPEDIIHKDHLPEAFHPFLLDNHTSLIHQYKRLLSDLLNHYIIHNNNSQHHTSFTDFIQNFYFHKGRGQEHTTNYRDHLLNFIKDEYT